MICSLPTQEYSTYGNLMLIAPLKKSLIPEHQMCDVERGKKKADYTAYSTAIYIERLHLMGKTDERAGAGGKLRERGRK